MYYKIINIKLEEVFYHMLQDALVSAVGRQIFGQRPKLKTAHEKSLAPKLTLIFFTKTYLNRSVFFLGSMKSWPLSLRVHYI